MDFFSKSIDFTLNYFNSDKRLGLTDKQLNKNLSKYGKNLLSKKKKTPFISKLFSCFLEPMILILIFGFLIAFGTCLGKFFKTNEFDFNECGGILAAIFLSVSITLIMEGNSEKAFEKLNKIYDNLTVKVIRNGQTLVLPRHSIAVGDLVIVESGDKVVADGRLIKSNGLSVDESALTGESVTTNKSADVILKENTPLAERSNCLYSGTFIANGDGVMVVTSVGDNTEIGSIADELKQETDTQSPLQQKLGNLGKTITIIGLICSITVFILSLSKLIVTGQFSFDSLQELFISCIVLIVAAVPEGLPTIVAVSLALNMIKLAKENALIKKMTATETSGAVSVICSDKTGTLTKNRMEVKGICTGDICIMKGVTSNKNLLSNFAINTTADVIGDKKTIYKGSGTECALLLAYNNSIKSGYKKERQNANIVYKQPFNSDKKLMKTGIKTNNGYKIFLKGAPEKVLQLCNLSQDKKEKLLREISQKQTKSYRVICFAHLDTLIIPNGEEDRGYIFDGYVLLADPIREEVKKAVYDCNRAGIKIKMLTGDNYQTAFAIAKELNIATLESQVVNATELESLTDKELSKRLDKVTVIARSTPNLKLRIVKALKNNGEVVAVTGDGINDAPAIKHADIGIAMGVSGSEITKEAADVILLDDSFATVVKAVSFGRTVYKNLQRFILFQLSVNLSALLFITVCAILGKPTPFNTLQLLWINVIMDGPPALTLGLEGVDDRLLNYKPIKREQGIVSGKMLLRILFNGIFIGGVLICEYLFNFMGVAEKERSSVCFSLFILFQLFNAFNSRELGKESIFKGFTKNKIMLLTFLLTFIIHIFIVQVAYPIFLITPLSMVSWLKCLGVAITIVFISEAYKLIYRVAKRNRK